ncbi:MAG: TolC family protein [Desulfovibrio sp.]|nr:TolC family protein [Desulfovibrio sp.]
MRNSISVIVLAAVCALALLASDTLAAQKAGKKAAGNGSTFTIGQAVEEALRANPGIEAKKLMVENARMNVGVAQSTFWPRVSLNWSSNRIKNYEEVNTYNADNLSSFNWNKGIRVSYPLFAGFAHLSALQKSLLQKDMQIHQQHQASLELANNVQMQFLQLLKSREDLKTAQDSIKRLETQLAAAEAFVEMDMAPYLNVLQNRTDLANARQNLIRVQNDIRNCEVQLNRFLARPDAANIKYVGSLKDFPVKSAGITEEEAIREALAHRPDLKAAQKAIEVAFKDMRISMSQFLPRIDLNYDDMASSKDYDNSQYQGYTRNYWSAGITFTWEVFSGGQTTFQSIADKKRADSLRKDYEEAVNTARAEVIRAILDIDSSREMIEAARKGLSAAQEAYDMAVTRYETDTGTITELLDGQLRLTQAQNDLAAALASCQIARSRLFFSLGRENASLK